MQVFSPTVFNNFVQARLVNGQAITVPLFNSRFVGVDDKDTQVRTFESDDTTSRTPDIASPDTANVFDLFLLHWAHDVKMKVVQKVGGMRRKN